LVAAAVDRVRLVALSVLEDSLDTAADIDQDTVARAVHSWDFRIRSQLADHPPPADMDLAAAHLGFEAAHKWAQAVDQQPDTRLAH
jgi:hypothetical protein